MVLRAGGLMTNATLAISSERTIDLSRQLRTLNALPASMAAMVQIVHSACGRRLWPTTIWTRSRRGFCASPTSRPRSDSYRKEGEARCSGKPSSCASPLLPHATRSARLPTLPDGLEIGTAFGRPQQALPVQAAKYTSSIDKRGATLTSS